MPDINTVHRQPALREESDKKARLSRNLFFLAVVLAALLAERFVIKAFLSEESHHLQLVIEMTSSASSLAKLFVDTGAGYNEGETEVLPLESPGMQRLEFKLPRKQIRALRFDPTEVPAQYRIRRIFVGRDSHSEIFAIPPADIRPFNQIAATRIEGREMYLETTPGANDPGLSIVLRKPVDGVVGLSRRQLWLFVLFTLLVSAASMLLARSAALFARAYRKFRTVIGLVDLHFAGIRYVAFDYLPSASSAAGLIPISSGPVDDFWLYRLP